MNTGIPITAWETASGEPHDRGPWEPVAVPHSWDARTGARRVYRAFLGGRLTRSPAARHHLRFGACHPAIQVRRHQVERLRRRIPGAGYVINAARDIPAAPVGLASTRGTDKFRAEDFAWQRDTMPLVDLPRRSFVAGEAISIPAWLSHFGADTLTEAPVRWRASWAAGSLAPVTAAPGTTLPLGTIDFVAPMVSDATPLDLALEPGKTHRLRLDIRDWRGAGGLIGPLYLTTNPENRLVY